MKVLITCSGVGSRMGNYTKFTNKALIKIGDKFSIDYIINNFKHILNVEFVITLGYHGNFVKQYTEIAYPELNFTFIDVDKYDGIGSSQGYSLLKAKNSLQEPFIFIACDTIILDNMYNQDNYKIDCNQIYLYKSDDSTNYSTVKCNNNQIVTIYDKGEIIFDYIYIGKCQIFNYKEFWNNLEKLYIMDSNNLNLGDINVYNNMLDQKIKFKYKVVSQWYDAGTTSIFAKDINKNQIYNVLTKYDESISFLDDKVVKFFYNAIRNIKRVERGLYLKDISPKIYNSTENFHSMEKINSKPISEIYEDNLIYKLLSWSKEHLWIQYNTPIDFKNTLYSFYHDKTIDRIDKAKKQNILDFNIINGIDIGDIYELVSKVNFDDLCKSNATGFHGDFILDNILMNESKKFILIDWREDFGGDIKNGDIYYDLAKLKHNIYLNHHNLESKLFDLKEIDKNSCIVDIKCNYFLINQINSYEKFINENNYDNRKINILMSLIWINMAPLHENPLNNFLFNFGKYNLYRYINIDKL